MEKNFKTVSKLLFPEETALNQTPSQKFENMLRKQLYSMRQERLSAEEQAPTENLTQNENYTIIADFIKQHVLTVGKGQAVKDFQCGLNFLHKDLIQPLKEDGEFGEKTFKAFFDIFKYYDIEIIKNAIRKGALSNTVIGTSSDKNVNTTAMVKQVNNNLGGVN